LASEAKVLFVKKQLTTGLMTITVLSAMMGMSPAATILMDYDDGVAGGGHDTVVRDGDFQNATGSGDARPFNQMPNWTNLTGAQTMQATRSNLGSGVGGSRNAALATGRTFGQALGHTVVTGDAFNASFMWRDASNWDDNADRVHLSLYYTDDDTLTGTRTDLVTFTSANSAANSSYQTENYTTGFAPAAADGKALFVRLDTTSSASEFVRLDNVFVSTADGGRSMLSVGDSGFERQGANPQDNVDSATAPWYTAPSGGGSEGEPTSVAIRDTGDTGASTIPAGVNGDHALRLGFKYDAVSVRQNTGHLIDPNRTYTIELRAAANDVPANDPPFSQAFQALLNADNTTNVSQSSGFVATDDWQTFSFDITPEELAGFGGNQIQLRLYKGAGTDDFVWIDDMKLFASTPTDVSGDQTQSIDGIEVFVERTLRLTSDLAVDRLTPAGTTIGPNAASDGSVIPEGALVTSHFVHFDPNATSGGVTAQGTFTFDDPIAGVIFTVGELDATDDLLGLDSVFYPSDGGTTAYRGALGEANDLMVISPDGRTMDLTLFVGTGQTGAVDQFRVLTMAVPEPSSLLLSIVAVVLGAVVLLYRNKRKCAA